MAFVVTENCRGCKYTDCVVECPCDCFYEDDDMLVIDPEICIDCGACAPACPVEAIFMDSSIPDSQKQYIQINADRVKVLIAEGKQLTKKQPAMKGPGCKG